MDTKKPIQIAKKAYEETEGLPEELRKITFQTFLEKAIDDEISPQVEVPKQEKKKKTKEAKKTKGDAKRKGKPESWDIDEEIRKLCNESDVKLIDFFNEKQPDTVEKCIVLFAYYMKQHLGIDGASIDQIYTCFKVASADLPRALKQSITNIENRPKKGWVYKNAEGKIVLSSAGENLVEKELPKKRNTNNG